MAQTKTFTALDSTSTRIALSRTASGAIIIYGRGAELGDFNIFAKCLRKDLSKNFADNVLIKRIENKTEFFDYFTTTKFGFRLKELHIFSHAFGPGLAFGYGDQAIAQKRTDFYNNKLAWYYDNNQLDKLYDDIIQLEQGILFVDDLLHAPKRMRDSVRKLFVPANAFVKLWGCNSAVENWVYDTSDPYWGALNRKLNPKPSIAQTVATFCNITTYGAASGAHIEVMDGDKWVSSAEYKKKYNTYPSGILPHRLSPDSGEYIAHNP